MLLNLNNVSFCVLFLIIVGLNSIYMLCFLVALHVNIIFDIILIYFLMESIWLSTLWNSFFIYIFHVTLGVYIILCLLIWNFFFFLLAFFVLFFFSFSFPFFSFSFSLYFILYFSFFFLFSLFFLSFFFFFHSFFLIFLYFFSPFLFFFFFFFLFCLHRLLGQQTEPITSCPLIVLL